MTTEWIPFVLTFAFLYGIVIGSFLNVCIYRIPAGESVAGEHSHCMHCGYRLKWYDLIPVLSWLLLRGKCRRCGKKISIQYPLVELADGFLYLFIFYANGINAVSVLYCLMASALLVLSVIDARTCEIPVGLNLFLLALGCVRIALDREHWPVYAAGFFAISIFLELIRLLSKGKAIGGGDVKLMAAAGLLLGWKKIILAFFIGCIAGAVIHTIRMKISGAGRILALGPYLSAGILLSALWGETWIEAYLQLLMGM